MEKEKEGAGALGAGAGSDAKYDVDVVAAPKSVLLLLVENGSCRTSSSDFFANMDCAVKKREEGIDLNIRAHTRERIRKAMLIQVCMPCGNL